MTPFYGEPDHAAGIATIRRPLEVVRLDAAFGGGPRGQEPLGRPAVGPGLPRRMTGSAPIRLNGDPNSHHNGWGLSRPPLCCSRAVGHLEEPH